MGSFRFSCCGIALLAASVRLDASNIVAYPANGATGVPLNARVLIWTGDPNANTTISVTTGSDNVAGTTKYAQLAWQVFTPAQPLKPQTTYNVKLSSPRDSYS